jgi:transcriptional regulator with XRE-family HTH domain
MSRVPLYVGEAIRAARAEAHCTQHQLARALRIHQSIVSRIELGERHCTLHELIAIAHRLRIKPEDLFRRIVEASESRPSP